MIRYNITNPRFFLVNQIDLCPNREDVYGEEQRDFAITYGTFTDFECYSPEELLGAFIIENDRPLFRIPTRTARVFAPEAIRQLLQTLQQQHPSLLKNFTHRTTQLIRKIVGIFNETNVINLQESMKQLQELKGSDREHSINIFRALFDAGMYQRTWKGPGFAYPLKSNETRDSCLRDIEKKMTPEFAKIESEYDKITKKDVIEDLPLFFSVTELYPQKMMAFVRQTAEGNACIGGGSKMMIETGYNYLKILGVKIDGFDYSEFEGRSTDR
jgi:hypothetical protein